MNIKSTLSNYTASSATNSKHKHTSSIDTSNKAAKKSSLEASKQILKRFIPLFCCSKKDSTDLKYKFTSHKKSFSVIKQVDNLNVAQPRKASIGCPITKKTEEKCPVLSSNQDIDKSASRRAKSSNENVMHGKKSTGNTSKLGNKGDLKHKTHAKILKYSNIETKKKTSITTPSTPLKQHKGLLKKSKVNNSGVNLTKGKIDNKRLYIKDSVQKSNSHCKRSISDSINLLVENIIKLKSIDAKKKKKLAKGQRYSTERLVETCDIANEDSKENKRSISSSGNFLIMKRASVPVNGKKNLIKREQRKCKNINKSLKKSNINIVVNLGNIQTSGNTFSVPLKTDTFYNKEQPPSKKSNNTLSSKYKLYENLTKTKASGSPQLENTHKGHKHTPSLCIPKQSLKVDQKGLVTKPSSNQSPFVFMKNLIVSVPISKGNSKTNSPHNEKERCENKLKVNPTILIKNSIKSKVAPLSIENVEKLDNAWEGMEVVNYIKDYYKQLGEVPPTNTNFYRIGRLLGKGAFGKVSLGMHKLTGKLVAVKSLKKQYLEDEASKKKVMQEISILKRLRHPNVIRLYESFESAKYIVIVTELCTGGDLLNYVRDKKKLNERMAKFVFKKLLNGLRHCHSRGVLHRDVKLDNVLLNGEGELKICDFGVSKLVRRGEKLTEQCGTPAYIAPEILRDKGYEGFSVDIWSAGVALYAILYGTVPFKANNIKDLHKLIMKGKYNLKEEVSIEVRDLLKKMLECNPYKRITIPEILKHSWMQDVDDSISLFTKEEKAALRKEYNYGCDRVKLNGETNTLFTEQNVDSTQDEQNRNETSKSLILAPFNSSQSDLGSSSDYISKDCSVNQKKDIIKFSAKVRDVDRQYEKNNNGDIDNGVYNKFICDSNEDINIEESSLESITLTNNSLDSLKNFAKVEHYRDVQFAERVSSHVTSEVAIDRKALKRIEEFGYKSDYVEKCLKENQLNYATATYYLLTNDYF